MIGERELLVYVLPPHIYIHTSALVQEGTRHTNCGCVKRCDGILVALSLDRQRRLEMRSETISDDGNVRQNLSFLNKVDFKSDLEAFVESERSKRSYCPFD